MFVVESSKSQADRRATGVETLNSDTGSGRGSEQKGIWRKWWKIRNPGIMARRNRKKINENTRRDVRIQEKVNSEKWPDGRDLRWSPACNLKSYKLSLSFTSFKYMLTLITVTVTF